MTSILVYLNARLREASSWAGIAATALAAAHLSQAASAAQALGTVFVAVSGLLAVLIPEGKGRG